MTGKKGLSGRKKKLSTVVRIALDDNAQYFPQILSKLRELCFERDDREACVELSHRIAGKPKSEIELTGTDNLGRGTVLKMFELMEQYRKDLLQGERKQIATKQEEEQGEDAVTPCAT